MEMCWAEGTATPKLNQNAVTFEFTSSQAGAAHREVSREPPRFALCRRAPICAPAWIVLQSAMKQGRLHK
jgi:hypothetical protein